ncbi:MAG: ABC transporter substrate-binding protein [Trebonia sp.]
MVTHLKSVIGRHAHTEALRDGRVTSPRVSLEFEAVEGVLRNAMTSMARGADFDLCEMSPTSYLMARLDGAPLIALPVFPYRQFPLGQIVVRVDAGVRGPGDLPGKRIGTRTWAQPTGLWIREMLHAQYGCDLSDSRWTFVAEDPFPGVRRPEGSVDRRGQTLTSLLADGHVDVAIGLAEVPAGCQPLFGQPAAEARSWYERTRLIPVNHLIALRAEHRDRGLTGELCRMFEAAKREFLDSAGLDSAGLDSAGLNGADHAGLAGPEVGPLRLVTGLVDPLPYGWSANEAVCVALIEAMGRQGMCDARPPVAEFIEAVEPA